jgi:hypothetical protein
VQISEGWEILDTNQIAIPPLDEKMDGQKAPLEIWVRRQPNG